MRERRARTEKEGESTLIIRSLGEHGRRQRWWPTGMAVPMAGTVAAATADDDDDDDDDVSARGAFA